MKRTILFVLASIALAIGSHAIVGTRTAHCAFCYTGPCYNSRMCGRGCVCLKQGIDLEGECYSMK